MCESVHLYWPGEDPGALLYHSPSYFLEGGSVTESEAQLFT